MSTLDGSFRVQHAAGTAVLVASLIAFQGCSAGPTGGTEDASRSDAGSGADSSNPGDDTRSAGDTSIRDCGADAHRGLPTPERGTLYARPTTPERVSNDGDLSEYGARWVEYTDRTGGSDNRVAVSALSTDAALHVGLRIVDGSIESPESADSWNRDSIEFAWAPDPVDSDTRSDRAGKWLLTAAGDLRYDRTRDAKWQGASTPAGTRHSVRETAEGYHVELTLPWSAGGIDPQDGDSLAICIRNNDRDDGAVERIGCRSEADSFADPSTWSTLRLVGEQTGCTSVDPPSDAGPDTGPDAGPDGGPDAETPDSNVCGDEATVPSNPDTVVDPSKGETLKAAVQNASDGDTILLKDGVDTSAGVRIHDIDNLTIVVDEGATYVLDGKGYDPADGTIGAVSLDGADGLTFDGTPGKFLLKRPHSHGFTVFRSEDYTIRGVTITRTWKEGVWVGDGSKNGLFERVRSFGANGFKVDQPGLTDGFVLYGNDPIPTNTTFRCTVAHHNSDDGFDSIQGRKTTIEYTLVWANGYNLNGKNSPAPGVGFKLSYDGESYESNQIVPDGNVVRNSLSFHNGGCGVMFGDKQMKVRNVTAWGNARKTSSEVQNNDCRLGGNRGDITNWDADSGTIERSLAGFIEQTSSITYSNNLTKPPSDWQMDRAVDQSFAPKNPETFGVPKAGSEIDQNNVGAAEPGADWVEEVLREAGQ